MEKPTFAIVGCGYIAKRHLRQILSVGTLVAVCDTDPEQAKPFITSSSVIFFDSLEKLVEAQLQIDIAVICTPNGLHAKQAILCLQKGYHVLVEKPMALTEKDALAMMATANEYKRYLFTVLQNRYNAPVLAVYHALKSGALGKPFSVQVSCLWNRNEQYYNHPWHGSRNLDGGILFTQFSHFIDLLLWYFGPVQEVVAVMHNTNHSQTALAEDEGGVLLKFENGMIGTIHFSTNAYLKNMEGSVTLLAEKGTVKIGGTYLNEIVYQETMEPIIAGITDVNETLQQVYDSMIRTLEQGDRYYANPAESVNTIALIERIYHAVK